MSVHDYHYYRNHSSMEADRGHESLPLLGISRPERLHYLDNLRATLTVVLIFNHAVKQVGSTPMPLTIFALINRSALWALFFFVSGRSAALAVSRASDYQFFLTRIFKVALPAWIYALLLRPLLITFLSMVRKDVFGRHGIWIKVSGPTAYVSILLFLDFLYLFLRWCARRSPNLPPLPFLASLQPTSRTDFVKITTFAAVTMAAFHFLRSILYRIEPHAYYPYFFDSYDQPGADAPLSYIIAYLVGVRFGSLKEYLAISLNNAYIILLGSIVLSYVTAATYFLLMVRAIPTSGLRFLVQAFIFALWDTFVFYTIPPAVISIFSQASWTTHEWGFLARHTYIQTYVNMWAILLAAHLVGLVHDQFTKAFVIGLFGVVVSWMIMVGLVLLWTSLSTSRS